MYFLLLRVSRIWTSLSWLLAYGGKILGSSWFSILLKVPQKKTLATKVFQSDPKIINFLPWSLPWLHISYEFQNRVCWIPLWRFSVSKFPPNSNYRVCHGFRFTKRDDYFRVTFDHFWSKRHFLRQLEQ